MHAFEIKKILSYRQQIVHQLCTQSNNSTKMTFKGHLRSIKMVPFESLNKISYSHSIVTISVSLAVSEIFSVKMA